VSRIFNAHLRRASRLPATSLPLRVTIVFADPASVPMDAATSTSSASDDSHNIELLRPVCHGERSPKAEDLLLFAFSVEGSQPPLKGTLSFYEIVDSTPRAKTKVTVKGHCPRDRLIEETAVQILNNSPCSTHTKTIYWQTVKMLESKKVLVPKGPQGGKILAAPHEVTAEEGPEEVSRIFDAHLCCASALPATSLPLQVTIVFADPASVPMDAATSMVSVSGDSDNMDPGEAILPACVVLLCQSSPLQCSCSSSSFHTCFDVDFSQPNRSSCFPLPLASTPTHQRVPQEELHLLVPRLLLPPQQ